MITLLILVLVAFGVVMGVRRGAIHVGLEVVTLVAATLLAWQLAPLVAMPLSDALGHLKSLTYAFAICWVVLEVVLAIIVRATLFGRTEGYRLVWHLDAPVAGLLNGAKVAVIVVIAVTAYAALPLPESAVRLVTDDGAAKTIIASTPRLQQWWDDGPGQALAETVTQYVISSDPESTERVNLEFTTTAGVVAPELEREMLALVNRERTSRGLAALRSNPEATAVARSYAQTMLAEGFFSHIDNAGKNPFARLKAGNVPFGAAGENLALAANLKRAHVGLMESPGHRANILSPNYGTVGIGIIDAGKYGLMVVQEFTD